MRARAVHVIGLAALLAACGRPPASLDSGPTETSTSSSSNGTSEVTSGTPSETETETGEDSTSLPFVPDDDLSSFPKPCDMLYPSPNCSEGDKCVPGIVQGEQSRVCRPVVGDGEPGEPCEVDEDSVDTCGEDSWCLYGTCRAYCMGTLDDPECLDPETSCMVTNDNAHVACMPSCDPLAPACPADETCVFTSSSAHIAFSCLALDEVPAKTLGEACTGINSCAQGLQCVSGDFVPECADAWCCAAYCDDDDPDVVCETPGTSCEWFWDEEPQAWANLGICVLPP